MTTLALLSKNSNNLYFKHIGSKKEPGVLLENKRGYSMHEERIVLPSAAVLIARPDLLGVLGRMID